MRPINFDTILVVRTDRDLRAALPGAARRERTTASALVRKAVAAIVATDAPPLTPAPAAPAAAMQMAA